MTSRKFGFDTSASLKQLLAEHFDTWRRTHGGDLGDLAEKCGVTSAYLSHVRRYGRIPSRPVLLLLALNFGLDGQRVFNAAEISDPFPYEKDLRITRYTSSQDGVFSLRFNMEAFNDSIRSIVRSEVRQRSVRDLLGARPLKIGLNYHQYWLFGSVSPPADGKHTGPFPEFCAMLGVALQKEVELVHVPFADYMEMLNSGQIDLFGPTLTVPNRPGHHHFSDPIFRLGVSATFRKKQHPNLPELPTPKHVSELRDDKYQIAVLKNSLSQLIANTLLKRSDSSLILVSSDDEGIERITMRGVNRPAHIFLSNSMTATLTARKHPKELELLFATRKNLLDLGENSIAIRPDWPEVVPVINDAIHFVQARGELVEQIVKLYGPETREILDFAAWARGV